MAHCKANQLDCNGFCNRFDSPCIKKNCRFFGVKTNADRIRAMSDDELAEFLCDRMAHCDPRYCPGCETCGIEIGKASGLKNWLQQPAEEG